MQIEEKFHRRPVKDLLDVGLPSVHTGPPYPLGIEVSFRDGDLVTGRRLRVHMTPHEALAHAAELIKAASAALDGQHLALTQALARAGQAQPPA
ncbi:hypothetical protein [Cupriavidus pampae]|uniref:Uncharacterized protein n=1 Tax=Cupriavidus pampae TaxID=659251 RepID=A0ABM8XUM8_9BURK|nr:hypothetical protein [Cupriavidus pampae]CAG9184086.1 hypothetical protein LMG32289_05505 [Cupriavidus pampae]